MASMMQSLIIDDDPVSRLYLEKILAPFAEVVSAHSGEEGVAVFGERLAARRPFDTVFVDIQMPGMDGHQALRKMRALEVQHGTAGRLEAKVFMVSGLDDARNVNQAFFQGGALSYLTKPLDRDRLLEELRNFGLIP